MNIMTVKQANDESEQSCLNGTGEFRGVENRKKRPLARWHRCSAMRLLIAVFAAFAAAIAAPQNGFLESFISRPIDFQSLPNYYPPLPEVHTRSKRAVIGLSNSCEPGWTGANCENPICSSSSTPAAVGQTSNIEILFLEGSCNGAYYIPIDSDAASNLQIHISASGVPYLNLTAANGIIANASYVYLGDGYALYTFSGITPGGYSLTVDNQNTPTTQCIIEVSTYTDLKVSQGFVYQPQDDVPPFGESAVSGVPMYLVAHAQNAVQPAQTNAVTIRTGASLTPTYRSLLTKRYGCGYELYAGQFQCSLGATYFYHVDGTDPLGYPYRRTGRFTCMEQVTTSAPVTVAPSTSAPISFCYNNGTLLRPASGATSMCFCPELYSGPQCEKPNCMNGGYPDPITGLNCVCPDGYYGPNCQDVICPLNWEPYLVDYKTLVVIIRDTQSMAQYVPAISTAIKNELMEGNSYDYDIYKGYILVKFANNSYTSKYYPSYSQDDFINDLSKPSTNPGGCNETTFDAIISVFNLAVYQRSPFYLFTDALALDSDKWQSVTESNTREKFPIYSFLFNQANCVQDPLDPGFRAIQTASFFSSGLVIQPSINVLSRTVQTLVKATTYKMNSVLVDDMMQCSVPSYRVFFADSSTTNLIFLAVGENLIVSVTDPNGSSSTLVPIITTGTTFFYEIISPIVGEHLMTVTAANPNTPCSYRVMARSEYNLFLGTTDIVSEDAGDSEPVLGQSHHFVAQLTGLKDNVKDPFRLFSEITITTNWNNDNIYQKPVYYSSGKYRNGCGYHLYFGAANICEFMYQPFYATVYADDGNGYTIQRTTVGYCSGTPTTPYPPNTCQNGGVFDPTDNSTCICPPNFSGKFCEQIVCTNGGTPAGTFCTCPAGTGGIFCEQYACPIINTAPDTSFGGQSMAFVISARKSMQDALNKLSANIETFTRDAQAQSPTWINQWILIYVNSAGYNRTVYSDKPSDFVAGVQDLAANLSNYIVAQEPSCKVQIEAAMLGAALLSEKRSSVWVFADSDGPDDSSYIQLYDIAQQYQISLNLVGVGNSICTDPQNNGQFPTYLTSLATASYGNVYMTAQVDQILFFIVSMYKSGVSHRYVVDDCTQPVSYYMPVDGWTQSLTMAVTGPNLKSVTVQYPDGSPALNSDLEIVSINDPELKLNQYMPPCDGRFWNFRQQNCFKFDSNKLAWFDGWSYCHNEGGFIAHIENQDTNDFCQRKILGQASPYTIWIGLVFNAGQWYWDVPDGNRAQPLGAYQNWADGVDPKNPAFHYVAMNADGKWVPTDMSSQNYVACQKHRYGQGLYPGESANVIPGGLWKVTVQSNAGSCSVQTRSQSEIQVFFGFVQDPHTDYPETYANIQSQSNYLVALPTSINPFSPDNSMEGRLNYAVLAENGTVAFSLPLNNRWSCSYPFISSPFTCPQDQGSVSDFSIKFTGIDQYGYAFERYSDAICTKYVTKCNNGGFLNNGVCVCRPGWIGTSCSTPVCQNNGYERMGRCVCQPMFTGTFCESPFCEPPMPKVFKDTGRTLAILLETSTNMGATIYQMKRNIKAALDNFNNDPTTAGWFSNYVLYPFDSVANKASWYPVVQSQNSDDIVAGIKNISTNSCPGNQPCSSSCPRPIVSVLQDVLNMDGFATPNSVILVVTRSSPEDYLQVGTIAQKLQESKPYVNFVYPAIDSPCGNGWNTPEAGALYRIVGYSQGNAFTMSATDFSVNFLQKYIPTLYSSGGLAASTGNCTYEEVMFQVEFETYEFTIDYYHPSMGAITVYDPTGQQVILPNNIINSDTNFIGVVAVNETGATKAGTYRVVIQGGGGNTCFLSVRARSSIEIYLGFVDSSADQYQGANQDNAHYAPVVLENNTVVVHAAGLGKGVLRYVQMVAPAYGLVHTSEMKRRDSGCSYEWYSTQPMAYDYDTLNVIIYGRDELGYYFSRRFQITTVGTRPIVKPPPAFCDLNAVTQDTLFIIDGSMKPSESTFSILKHFAAQSMQPYNYGSSLAQVAAMTLAESPQGGFSFNAGENSYDRVSGLINNLTAPGTAGQNVTAALQYVIDYYDNPAQGYRTDPNVKHLLVYITNTNPTDADPSSLVRNIKRSGLYGIIVVALDMQPSQALKNMVGSNCFYYSEDYHDLMNYGVNFVQLQSCLRNNPCNV
ncbi:unnamed protein product [Caenorhabditis auriculariae]|uniref:Uncharacterized protein n=1 Tax=Caenorhabditis auriculariae TaxID=2777116 RepID=A0A8S1H1J0_9PELO|nr:unnamed protein product [Caenorhabditis auriculariae]